MVVHLGYMVTEILQTNLQMKNPDGEGSSMGEP